MSRPLLVADISLRAREDVRTIAATINTEQPKAAFRFLDDFDAAVELLLQFPELAQRWKTKHPKDFADVRRYVMRTFRVSIFYRPNETTLQVLRVLHHARHVPPLLDDLDDE